MLIYFRKMCWVVWMLGGNANFYNKVRRLVPAGTLDDAASFALATRLFQIAATL